MELLCILALFLVLMRSNIKEIEEIEADLVEPMGGITFFYLIMNQILSKILSNITSEDIENEIFDNSY